MNSEDMRTFVLDNFDDALKQGKLKLYYQPIIRALTGEICAMEGLARWQDDELGLISPANFIPVLEEEGLIYKLDSYLIRQMCIEYDKAYKNGEILLPVSLNFSRKDFEMTDIFKVLEENTKEFKVPRDMINIEITESTAGRSKEFIQNKIKRLRSEGYEVWMDDFGSEYSSLNVLKDFDLDLVKIDLRFLELNTVKAKQIVRFMIDMLKTIGVKTLAEGVETKEQYDFLREIGCDKIQGFYIGKPMPGVDVKDYLRLRGFKCEEHINLKYYDDIARLNILSQTPAHDFINAKKGKVEATDNIESLAIIEVDDGALAFKYYNKKYLEELQSVGISSVYELEGILSNDNNLLRKKIKFMLNTVEEGNEECVVDHIFRDNFCIIRICKIAEENKRRSYATKFINVSNNKDMLRLYNRSIDISAIYNAFSNVDIIDIEKKRIKNIYTNIQNIERSDDADCSKDILLFMNKHVYPMDREQFLEFYDVSTMYERLIKTPNNKLEIYYRIKDIEGEYKWCKGVLMLASTNNKKRVISCLYIIERNDLLNVPLEKMLHGLEIKNETFTDANLWQNFISNTDIGMFWKDKDRRFVGVNRAFLDYYGFKSPDNVIGKNDEDMGWHIDPEKFKNDEEDILKQGIQTHSVTGTCLNNGSIRNIKASKMPYYKDGKIEGLIGYFIEVGDRAKSLGDQDYRDDITIALNMKGLLDSAQQFVDSYIMHHYDFNIFYIDIVDFRHFINSNGHKLSIRVLEEVALKIKEKIGTTGVLARIGGDHFIILKTVVNEEEDQKLIEEIREEIYNIRRIDNVPSTIYLNIDVDKFSNMKNLDNFIVNIIRKSVRADEG